MKVKKILSSRGMKRRGDLLVEAPICRLLSYIRQGRVVKPLTPVGTIIVNGEYWKAKSLDDNIEIDKDVEIVGIEGLMLRVKRNCHGTLKTGQLWTG